MDSSNEISMANKILALANNFGKKDIEEIKEQLIILINELIKTDFPSLIQLLYKIDVDEKKLKHLLKEQPDSNAASIISDLILARQLQKNEMRNKFKPPKNNTNESEYW